ncbi:thioredoxin-like protein [Pelagophyceae sp. CCMP2097]|nr:thioredoxin-like protein [Pelagophyceae sp. CCMP2097]
MKTSLLAALLLRVACASSAAPVAGLSPRTSKAWRAEHSHAAAALAVSRGGDLQPNRGAIGRLFELVTSFIASFFDPAFGPGASATAAPGGGGKAAAAPSTRGRTLKSAKTISLDELKKIEGGTVKAMASEAAFARELKTAGSKLVVVDFWATWCGPCQQFKPKYASMSERHSRQAAFLSVDVDAVKALAQKHSVSSMPTFVFFKRGVEVERFSGADENQLRDIISKLA